MRFMFFLLLLLFFSDIVNAFALYGHRGARGLAPENTLPAYQKALALGVDYVDMDVVMTQDNEIVAYHDLTLNPDTTRDAKGHWVSSSQFPVKNIRLHHLQAYDVGRLHPHTFYANLFHHQQAIEHTSIPTLIQVIQYVKQHAKKSVGFQIEMKTDPAHPDISSNPELFAKVLAAILEKENIVDRTQVQAYDWRCLLALQKINPRIATAYITDHEQERLMQNPDPSIAGLWTAGQLLKNYHNSIPRMVKALGGRYWDPEDREITPAQLKEAHQLGLKVITWSWAEQQQSDIDLLLTKQLIRMGVDGIITDRPDIVRRL